MARRQVVCAAVLIRALCAQQAAAPDEIRMGSRPYVPPSAHLQVETKLVDMSVTVRDAKGRAVSGLKREDFQIFDDGKERAIAAFAEEAESGRTTLAPSTDAAAPEVAPSTAPKSAEATPPARFLALFIDDVNAKDFAAAGDLPKTQAAAKKFVAEALRPGTRIGLFTVSGTVTEDFTTDAAKLTQAISNVKAHPRMSEIGLQYCPRITPYRAYQIVELHDRQLVWNIIAETGPAPHGYNCAASRDQVLAEAEETWRQVQQISLDTLASIDRVVNYLGQKQGTRVMVMASSGFLGQTLEAKQQAVIEHALHSGIVINALDSKGLYSEPPPGCRATDPDPMECMEGDRGFQYETMALGDRLMLANSTMADLAHGTGGEFFHNNNDLHAGLRELGVPPEVSYRISFNPEGVATDGSYHKLKVKLAHAGNYEVAARPGYFAAADKPAEDPQSKLDREVTGSDALADVPASVTTQVKRPAENQRNLSVVVRVDVSKLAFGTREDRRTQRITFVSALLDGRGNVVAAKQGWMDLALTSETYERLAKSGLNAALSFQVAPGVYGLREVVQESVHGGVFASTQSVDLK